jgi:hypothetical protein
MAETIDTVYSETDIADLRASGHWPAEDELDTTAEEETKTTGKRAASQDQTPA